MQISMIVAVATNGVIGKDGKMPWHLPSDLRHFKQLTMGKSVVMGRKTFDSIGKALPGRTNIVIGSQPDDLPRGVIGVKSPDEVFAAAQEPLMVIGGGQIYKVFEACADKLHLTRVHARPAGDTFFTLENPDDWHETDKKTVRASKGDSADMSFITLVKKR